MSPTRRDFLFTTAAATAGLALGRAGLASAQTSRAGSRQGQPQPVFTPLRRNVGTFSMMGGTVGWLVNAGGTVVVDTQFPDAARPLLEGLRARANRQDVSLVINTHHHGDHTGGNPVFRGVAKHVVAHSMADQHLRRAPGGAAVAPPPAGAPEPLYPDTTFTHTWSAEVGDERIVARHHGRAHTSGDAVITFERANVVHMGDLMFHQRHPVVDRAAGASMHNWRHVLAQVAAAHDAETIYIFGHAGSGRPVTGTAVDLLQFRDYLAALLAFVETQVKSGRSREEILTMREPLPGFAAWGRFGNPGGRDPLTVAVEEVTTGN